MSLLPAQEQRRAVLFYLAFFVLKQLFEQIIRRHLPDHEKRGQAICLISNLAGEHLSVYRFFKLNFVDNVFLL